MINLTSGTVIASGARQGDELGESTWVALIGKVILVTQLSFGLSAIVLLCFITYTHIYFLIDIKYYIINFFFSFCLFLGLLPRHMEVSRLGV